MMRKRNLKGMALSITLFSLLVGCGGNEQTGTKTSGAGASSSGSATTQNGASFNETGYPICDQTIEVTVGTAKGTFDFEKSKSWSIVEKDLGIKLKYQPIDKEVFNDKMTLMFSTDDLPDILDAESSTNLTLSKIGEYGSQGYFLDIKPYLNLMPNLSRVMEEDKSGTLKRIMTSTDGKMYGFPCYKESKFDTNPIRVWIDMDFLKNCNIEKIPQDLDGFYDMLVTFSQKDANGNGDVNDEIPLDYINNWHGNYVRHMLMTSFGITVSNSSLDCGIMLKDEKVQLAQTTDNYKEFLKFLNKLYKEKLLSQDAFTQTHDQHQANIAAEKTGVFGADAFNFSNNGVKDNSHYGYIGGLASKYTDNSVYMPKQEPCTLPIIFISAKTEYPEALCRLIDYYFDSKNWHATEDFDNLIVGFNAELKEYRDSGYKMLIEKDDWIRLTEEEKNKKAKENGFDAVGTNTFNLFLPKEGNNKGLMEAASDALLNSDDLINDFGWCAAEERWLRSVKYKEAYVYPTLAYTEEQATERARIRTDISTYVESMFAQFVTGKLDVDQNWDTFQNEIKKIGLEEMLKIEQEAYDASKKIK